MKRAIAFTVVCSLFSASPAFAHATLDRPEAPADSFYKAVFGIGHGCDGQATLRVRVRIPEGISSVKPQPKAGWELTMRREKLPQPRAGPHGVVISEAITEVMWSGNLPDENFEEFLIQVRLPNASGRTLYFPTVKNARPAWSVGLRFQPRASNDEIIPILPHRSRSRQKTLASVGKWDRISRAIPGICGPDVATPEQESAHERSCTFGGP